MDRLSQGKSKQISDAISIYLARTHARYVFISIVDTVKL